MASRPHRKALSDVRAAQVSFDGAVKVWNTETGACTRETMAENDEHLHGVSFSLPNGEQVRAIGAFLCDRLLQYLCGTHAVNRRLEYVLSNSHM